MYLLTIGVGFRRKTFRQCEVSTDWARALFLLRDSLRERFGRITVAAPEHGDDTGAWQQVTTCIDEPEDGIRFVSLGNAEWRARNFWRAYPGIRRTCDQLAQESDIVHCGINNLWQPYSLLGFASGKRMDRTTVFFLDGDVVERLRDLNRDAGPAQHLQDALYSAIYIRTAKWAVAHADLSLLKGRLLHERYGKDAKNAKDFFDTSFTNDDIIRPSDVERKCEALRRGEPLRCLSLGRLVDYKGIDHSLRAVAEANRQGARVQLDVIGDGPARAGLETLARQLEMGDTVRFLGPRAYGNELLRDVRQYHLLLFTSVVEETPRSLFDGMAAGCGLLAFDIPFTRQVIEQCRHGAVVTRGQHGELAARLVELNHARDVLTGWVDRAAKVAEEHSAEVWYQRRAAWTFEAFEKRRRRS
jgi:glycosyltransferase involved in cell wall biosynthesis